jgi:DNA-binding transcriptional MerR regulator
MSAVTESDLKEIKDLINAMNARLTGIETELKQVEQKLGSKIDSVGKRLDDLEKRSIAIETGIETWKPAIDKIPDLAEKFGELKNWRQIAFVLLTASIGGLVGWVVRGGNLRP